MTKRTMHGEVKIRRAKSADAPRIAVLAGQLGYPATASEMRKRLLGIKLPRCMPYSWQMRRRME